MDTATDGFEALQLWETAGPYDVLLTDIVMQGMSGLDLAKAVRQRAPETRLLYMSGYDMSERGQLDGTRFLRKPFTPRMLLDMLNAATAGMQN